MTNFWLGEALKFAVLFTIAYLLGLWVQRRGVRVNYTRKILHFVLFFVPLTLAAHLPFEGSVATVILSGLCFIGSILLLSAPLRSRSAFLATYAVLIAMLLVLERHDKTALIYITVLVAAIGDGLAEPVGVRFGRHTYRTRALFTDRRYTRSLEGSACVLLSGFLAVAAFRSQLDATQFILALLVIPAAMTLAEAFSPHTWDGPFLYLAGGLSTAGVLELGRVLTR